MHLLQCECSTKKKEFLKELKNKLIGMKECQVKSLMFMQCIEKCLVKKNCESANYENAIECDKIFLGWMSKS